MAAPKPPERLDGPGLLEGGALDGGGGDALDGGALLAGEPPAVPRPTAAEMERRWREVQADIRARRRAREKALKMMGASVDAFERRKALAVLGLREEDLEVGRRYFMYPGRKAVSLPSLEDAAAAHDAAGDDDDDGDGHARFPPAAAAALPPPPLLVERAVSPQRPSSAGWSDEPLTPRGVTVDGAPPFHYAARRWSRRPSLPTAVVRPKAVRVLGMDDHQVRRVKALTLLGVSDYEVEEDTSRALSQLGIQSPRDRDRAPARARSPA